MRSARRNIYYWKCDRPAAFYGLQGPRSSRPVAEIERMLLEVMVERFSGDRIELSEGLGQGNHITFSGTIGSEPVFVRVEDGPEGDDYMDVESQVLREVGDLKVPVPAVIHSDASRLEVPFTWQVLEKINEPDLNQHEKAGTLDLMAHGETIGKAVATWQTITPQGFGPFDPVTLRTSGILQGFHADYPSYFYTRLEEHLCFLVQEDFLSSSCADEYRRELLKHRPLLDETAGVLVHKDLALWNILGTAEKITAFIDWDDSIVGDATDDVSLLACFHDGPFIQRILSGYVSVRPLPPNFRLRFWLHLLRNMITKSVIRVGAGYFHKTDNFFLIGSGASGTSLEEATRRRLDAAWHGLRKESDPTIL